MCGIIGAYNCKAKIPLSVLTMRGRDGYGYYWDGKTFKHTSLAQGTVKTKNIFLGNARAIPTTEFEQGAGLDIVNQQPFESKRYVVVHNGLIFNDKQLIKKYKLKPKTKVDSEIIPLLFDKLGVFKAMEQIKGSYAILAYDKKTRDFYAIKNFMPLRIARWGKGYMFFSLEEMFPNLDSREVEPYTIYHIDEDSGIAKIALKEQMPSNKKALIICSGGTDSVTTAYVYKHFGYNVTLLHFNYGQAAQKVEQIAVQRIAKHLKCKCIVFDARETFKHYKNASKLLHQKKPKPKERMLDAESSLVSYVPQRNAIFALIACGLAEANKFGTVAFGAQLQDASAYPDNNSTFTDAVNTLLPYSSDVNSNIKFAAPLQHLMKHEVYQVGLDLKVPYINVVSCYYPKIKNGKIIPCYNCGCCQYREAGFKMIGIYDEQNPKNRVLIEKNVKLLPKTKLIKDINPFLKNYVEQWL